MNKFIKNILSTLILFIPFFIVLGPAIPDIIISLSAIYALSIIVIEKKFNRLNDIFFISLFLFWIVINTSSLFSENKIMSISSSLLYIRFIFFLLFVKFFFSQEVLKNINPFFVLSICLSFVIIDTYIQYFFRVDLFGNELDNDLAVRLTGPFLHGEQIVGSYLSKFGYIVIGYILGLQFKNNILYNVALGAFFISIYLIIFLSGERMAFILFNFGFLLFLIIDKKVFFKILKLFFICLPLIFLLIYTSKSHILKRAMTTFEIFGINFENKNIDDQNFFDSHYGAHYLTALNIFKDNPILGVGNKMFREECAKQKYENINSSMAESRCATHPHNIYFQLLSENGLFGILSFSFIVFLIFKHSLSQIKIDKSYLSKSVFISLILFLWPLQSNGGLYNNRYSTMLFFIIAILILLKEKKLNLNN